MAFFGTIVNIFRIPELRRKILFTLGLLCIYRIGFAVPLPGVDQGAFKLVMDRTAEGGGAFGQISFDHRREPAVAQCDLDFAGLGLAALQLVPWPPERAPLTLSAEATRRGITFVTTLMALHLAASVAFTGTS